MLPATETISCDHKNENDLDHRPRRKRIRRRLRPEERTRAAPKHDVRGTHPPDEVLRRREKYQTALDARTDVERLLGDPPLGFSALDARVTS